MNYKGYTIIIEQYTKNAVQVIIRKAGTTVYATVVDTRVHNPIDVAQEYIDKLEESK